MAADPLVDVAVGLYAEFGEHATLGEVLAGVDRCRRDLDTVDHPVNPERVQRLARQRLTDHSNDR